MQPTLYEDILKGIFRPFVGAVVEKDKERPYFYKNFLNYDFTPTFSWDSAGVSGSVVSADVVDIDSPLPVKSRPAISVASGEIPAIGLEYHLKASELQKIDTMIALGTPVERVRKALLDNTVRVIRGIEQRLDIMFIEALEKGYILTSDKNNLGVNIRASFGYLDENTIKVAKKWDSSGATPITDLQKLIQLARDNGQPIGRLFMSRKTLDQLKSNKEAKELVSAYMGVVGGTLPVITNGRLEEALKSELGVEINVVNVSYKVTNAEGKLTQYQPFEGNYVVGTPAGVLGRIVYGSSIEESKPVAGVNYAKAGDHILVSQYSDNNPYKEYTAGQALALPVIDVASEVYRLDLTQTA